MSGESEQRIVKDEQLELAVKVLRDLVCSTDSPVTIPVELVNHVAFVSLFNHIAEVRGLADGLAKGDLSTSVSCKGYLCGTLKTLQANLRHLVWQTKMVAAGDFTQRVAFMGDFAKSFNSMVHALAISQVALEKLASTDGLTGLSNRRAFFETGEAEFLRSKRHGHAMSMLALDLDDFKRINDTFGHQVGDQILQLTAEVLKHTIRAADTVGRIGGEEFAIILPETAASDALDLAQRIVNSIREMRLPLADGRTVSITTSIGVSSLTEQVSSFDVLLQRADVALYHAKDTGRDRVVLES